MAALLNDQIATKHIENGIRATGFAVSHDTIRQWRVAHDIHRS